MQIEHDMAEDMTRSPMILAKVKQDRYAQNLYAALCNMRWQKSEVWPVLKNDLWSCSWRSAGGIVAELQGQGDYMDWYCSGMGGLSDYHAEVNADYVPESCVTDEIRLDLASLGWHPVPWED
jgi:hypothetical protein